jgi:molybdopterin-containing oxidoreductase family iron-sulfur binding subunit
VKTRQENEHRLYHVLEELHVLPNITYLAKVRNQEAEAKEKV